MTEDTTIWDFHLQFEEWRQQGYIFYLYKPTPNEVWGHSANFDIEVRPLSAILYIYVGEMSTFNEFKDILNDMLDVEIEEEDEYVRWCM